MLIISLLVLALNIASCNPGAATPTPIDFKVTKILDDPEINQLVDQTVEFDQCDSDSPLKAEIQYRSTAGGSNEDELILGAEVGGSAGISEMAAVELRGKIEKHISSTITHEITAQQSLMIEVPPHKAQKYTIIWKESRRKGKVEYRENYAMKTAAYSFFLGRELETTTVDDIPCPGGSGSSTIPSPVPTDGTTETGDTTPGSVLAVGEWWKQENEWLRVQEVKFGNTQLSIKLEFWNRTNGPLTLEWKDGTTFTLLDNTGRKYKIQWQKIAESSRTIQAGESIQCEIETDRSAWNTENLFSEASITDFTFFIHYRTLFGWSKVKETGMA